MQENEKLCKTLWGGGEQSTKAIDIRMAQRNRGCGFKPLNGELEELWLQRCHLKKKRPEGLTEGGEGEGRGGEVVLWPPWVSEIDHSRKRDGWLTARLNGRSTHALHLAEGGMHQLWGRRTRQRAVDCVKDRRVKGHRSHDPLQGPFLFSESWEPLGVLRLPSSEFIFHSSSDRIIQVISVQVRHSVSAGLLSHRMLVYLLFFSTVL